MKTKLLLAAFLIASIGINGYLYWRNQQQKFMVELVSQKDVINQQQVNDCIMSTLASLRQDNGQILYRQGRVEGMVAAATHIKPEDSEVSDIWHQGYYSGLEQKKLELAYVRPTESLDKKNEKASAGVEVAPKK